MFKRIFLCHHAVLILRESYMYIHFSVDSSHQVFTFDLEVALARNSQENFLTENSRSPNDALRCPNWKIGQRITVSALFGSNQIGVTSTTKAEVVDNRDFSRRHVQLIFIDRGQTRCTCFVWGGNRTNDTRVCFMVRQPARPIAIKTMDVRLNGLMQLYWVHTYNPYFAFPAVEPFVHLLDVTGEERRWRWCYY